jgi:hypothetical protein
LLVELNVFSLLVGISMRTLLWFFFIVGVKKKVQDDIVFKNIFNNPLASLDELSSFSFSVLRHVEK